MPNFTRPFRNLVKLFPGAGNWQGPSAVSNVVAFVEQFSRPSIANELTFKTDVQTAATAGATTDLTHPEPAAGMIHVPVTWVVNYNGIVNIQCQALLARTASPLDVWGSWYPGAGPNQISSCRVGSVLAAQPEGLLMSAFPYMRGHQLIARFLTPAGATTVSSTLYFVEMPIELASIETWKPMLVNNTYTRALP